MPISCQLKQRYGRDFCVTDCPAHAAYVRVERPEDVPPADERTVDVAVLDMNHGWPNLGHDSLVHALIDASCDLLPVSRQTGVRVRVLSYDVRRRGVIPESPGGRFALYLGTGGPGHIDPAENDGSDEASQGLKEDPRWREPLFQLFDEILAEPSAALLAVCHSFGVMCLWSGIAHPSLRSAAKGGKSTGVLENVLAQGALDHPWFGRFAAELGGSRLRVLDNRLFDLIPDRERFPASGTEIGFETLGVGGPVGDALTMFEFDRDLGGTMPRVFGVNHHPEVVNREKQMLILNQRIERGEVSEQWAAERREILTRTYPDENSDRLLQLTSDFTLLGPMRFHLYRQVRLRAEALGHSVNLHEDRVASGHLEALEALDAMDLDHRINPLAVVGL